MKTNKPTINNKLQYSYRPALFSGANNANSSHNTLTCALSRYLVQLEPQVDATYLALIDQLVQTMEEGSSCLPVDNSNTISQYQTIGTGETPTPLVFKNNGLMLFRYFQYEYRIYQLLSAFSSKTSTSEADASLENPIHWQELAHLNHEQNQAVRYALTESVLILSGGPGTGKTTTLAEIVHALDAHSQQKITVHITAPTGKASAQLLASLQNKPLKQTHLNSATLHRLLEFNPLNERYRRTAANHLQGNLFIVDEASMINLELFYHFISALPVGAKLIITGDPKQLPAIDIGSVFSDLITLIEQKYLNIAHINLKQNYRFPDSHGIAKLAELIERSDGTGIEENVSEQAELQNIAADNKTLNNSVLCEQKLIDTLNSDGLEWQSDTSSFQAIKGIYQQAIEKYQKYFSVIYGHKSQVLENTPEAMQHYAQRCFNAFNQFQVLCSINNGRLGVNCFNQLIEKQLMDDLIQRSNPINRQSTNLINSRGFYHGRPIMITRNDYQNNLFNGDIGLVLHNEYGDLIAYFPALNLSKSTEIQPLTYRTLPLSALPLHETCFATSIHKSQGSEIDHVLLVLPEDSGILSQELLYTGVTRAKQSLSLAANVDTLVNCLKKHQQRHSYLSSIVNRI